MKVEINGIQVGILGNGCPTCKLVPSKEFLKGLIENSRRNCARCGHEVLLKGIEVKVSLTDGWMVYSGHFEESCKFVNSRNQISNPLGDENLILHEQCWKEAFPVHNTTQKLKEIPPESRTGE